MQVLAISGSLRAASSNAVLVRALARLAPPGVDVKPWAGLGALPHFNPDDDAEGAVLPPAVAALRAEIAASEALVISSPEYAHGVPGSLKNALDWLVSGPEMIDLAVAVIGASPRATHARAQLIETLSTMSTRVIGDASVAVDMGRGADEDAIVNDPALAAPLRAALAALALAAGRAR